MRTELLRAGLAALLLAACGTEPAPAVAPDDSTLADLAAHGYLGWDERAEAPLAAHGEPADEPFLYADDRNTVRLVANDGSELRTWHVLGCDQVEFAELLPAGGVVAVSVDQGVARLAADGTLQWWFECNAHHEVAPRAAGGFIVPVWRVHPHRGRRVRFDELVWLSAEGVEERRWSSYEHRSLLAAHHLPLALDTVPPAEADDGKTYDQYHVNTIVELSANRLGLGEPAGSLLLCLRNADLLIVLSPDGDRVLWSWGTDELDFPHTPTPTERGVLVFDNGYHRGWSRLVEVEPASGAIVWEWRAAVPTEFFSKTRGSCQRLDNGHTFVCESERGRLFELDAEGAVVWSWVNPEQRDGRRRRIYRARRVSASALQQR